MLLFNLTLIMYPNLIFPLPPTHRPSPPPKKNKITQNKCIRYCLRLDKMTHISKNEFETLNWLPVKDRFNQSKNSIVFKYFTKQCPQLVFELACPNNLRTRTSYMKLICPFQKTNTGQNPLFFISPSLWNKTLEVVLLSLKLLLSPFCFSYYFKFSKDYNENKAFACFVLSPSVFAFNYLRFISL